MATTNDRLLIGTRKGIVEARRNGGGWSLHGPSLPGQPIAYAVRDPRSGAVWASIDHGHWGVKLSRSAADDGAFEEVEAPKYPEATGKSATYYWIIQPGHADRPGHVFVGTNPGGLFQSTDDGASWQMNESLWAMCAEHKWEGGGRDDAGIHSICVDPSDPDHMYVGVSCAGVVETKDGGASWSYCNKGMRMDYWPPEEQDRAYGHDPHFVAMSPSDPSVLWQANHCGVYRTSNGAVSWDEVSDKPLVYFGFPVAVHPARPETAWLVPMKSDGERTTVDGRLVVVRTDDAGATWQAQTDGLPQENAWDFPYRHSLDVAPDGETLAFGTTSGNLYVSEDGGAHWDAVTHNLPLVYSVRFA